MFKGQARIGRGCRLCVGSKAIMICGENFNCTGDTSFICGHKIEIGQDCLFSWGIQVMDTDMHCIQDLSDDKVINPDQPIILGDHVWVACNTIILKGTQIPSNSIIAAGSIISSKQEYAEYCIIGGQGITRVLRHDVKWLL